MLAPTIRPSRMQWSESSNRDNAALVSMQSLERPNPGFAAVKNSRPGVHMKSRSEPASAFLRRFMDDHRQVRAISRLMKKSPQLSGSYRPEEASHECPLWSRLFFAARDPSSLRKPPELGSASCKKVVTPFAQETWELHSVSVLSCYLLSIKTVGKNADVLRRKELNGGFDHAARAIEAAGAEPSRRT